MPAMTTYFDLEVSLLGVKPRIWRRFVIRKNCDFHELHDTIQKACGWKDYHLYEFRKYVKGDVYTRGDSIACSPCVEPWDVDEAVPDARQIRIDSFFSYRPGVKCIYEYDFGDGWEHLVEVKAITQLEGRSRRQMVGGARAFPLEDCGGIPGYEECLEAFVKSPLEIREVVDATEREDLESRKNWMGDWHPERFDVEAVAKEFKRMVRFPDPFN
jgi:hypothetical protein